MTREEALDLIAKRMAFSEKDVAVCRAALDALTQAALAGKVEDAESNAVAEAVRAALHGEPVSDFMESFPLVRAAVDLRAEIATLRQENEALRQVCADAYQMAGALHANETALDNLAAAALGRPIPHEHMTPHMEGPCAWCDSLKKENEALRVAFDKQRALANDAGGKLADALIENEALRRERDAAREFAAYLAETVDMAMVADDPDDWNARGLEALERVKTWVNELAQEEARPDAGGEKLPQPAPCPTCTTMPPDSSWRWAGDCWQHKCPNIDPNAGHFTMPISTGR